MDNEFYMALGYPVTTVKRLRSRKMRSGSVCSDPKRTFSFRTISLDWPLFGEQESDL